MTTIENKVKTWNGKELVDYDGNTTTKRVVEDGKEVEYGTEKLGWARLAIAGGLIAMMAAGIYFSMQGTENRDIRTDYRPKTSDAYQTGSANVADK